MYIPLNKLMTCKLQIHIGVHLSVSTTCIYIQTKKQFAHRMSLLIHENLKIKNITNVLLICTAVDISKQSTRGE